MIPQVEKDPDARKDYGRDWAPWLGQDELITAHTVTAPAGITIDTHAHSDTTVTCFLSGGTAGEDYKVTFHMVTNQGRSDDKSLIVKVREQ
jgi:hypothetical protein